MDNYAYPNIHITISKSKRNDDSQRKRDVGQLVKTWIMKIEPKKFKFLNSWHMKRKVILINIEHKMADEEKGINDLISFYISDYINIYLVCLNLKKKSQFDSH